MGSSRAFLAHSAAMRLQKRESVNKIHGASCQQRAHMQRLVRGLRKQIGSELSVLAHFARLVQKTDRPNTKHAR